MGSLLPPPLPILLQLGIDPARIRLIKPISRRSQCRAVVNWLTQSSPSPDASNFEQVQGYLQAFQHLCDIDEHERAATLISTRLATEIDSSLHYNLKVWGYSQDLIKLYEALIDHISPKENGRFLHCLGTCHQILGNISEAKIYLERSLSIAQELGNSIDAGTVLCSLGDVYYVLGDYDQAINHQ